MVKLVALKTRRFGTVNVRAGGIFHTSRKYARIWKALGLAADPMTTPELLAGLEMTPGPVVDLDITDRTKAQLLDLAEAESVEVSRHATKAEIIAAIAEHRRNTGQGE